MVKIINIQINQISSVNDSQRVDMLLNVSTEPTIYTIDK